MFPTKKATAVLSSETLIQLLLALFFLLLLFYILVNVILQ